MFTHSFSSAASPGKLLNEEPGTQADPEWRLGPRLPYETNTHTLAHSRWTSAIQRHREWGQQHQATPALLFTTDMALCIQHHLPLWMQGLNFKSWPNQTKNINFQTWTPENVQKILFHTWIMQQETGRVGFFQNNWEISGPFRSEVASG